MNNDSAPKTHKLSFRIDSETADGIVEVAKQQIERSASNDIDLASTVRHILRLGIAAATTHTTNKESK
jgi:hypothetical protein